MQVQLKSSIEFGITNIAGKITLLLMFGLYVHSHGLICCRFVTTNMAHFKVAFVSMTSSFVSIQAFLETVRKIAKVTFPGFCCFMFVHYVLFQTFKMLKSKRYHQFPEPYLGFQVQGLLLFNLEPYLNLLAISHSKYETV